MRIRSLLSVFIALCLLLCDPASADSEFKLRNGILFGDTMETILEKETTLKRESEDSQWFKGRIAGYEGAECGFILDDDGKLADMTYSFGDDVCTSRDSMNEVYKTLFSSLNRLYGKPIGNTGGTTHLITGNAIDRMSIFVYLLGSLDGYSADYTDYDEWIVDCDEYHVKIDLISYYYRDSNYNYSYRVDLSYHRFTDEDLQKAMDEKNGKQQEVDNDL